MNCLIFLLGSFNELTKENSILSLSIQLFQHYSNIFCLEVTTIEFNGIEFLLSTLQIVASGETTLGSSVIYKRTIIHNSAVAQSLLQLSK